VHLAQRSAIRSFRRLGWQEQKTVCGTANAFTAIFVAPVQQGSCTSGVAKNLGQLIFLSVIWRDARVKAISSGVQTLRTFH
jgi:hypothetical protein